jgi:hypothetical protein
MSDASGATTLSFDDLLKLIAGVRAGTADPISTSLAIFRGVGENAFLSADVLRQALLQTSLSLDGPMPAALAAVESITKTGSLVTLVNNQVQQGDCDIIIRYVLF